VSSPVRAEKNFPKCRPICSRGSRKNDVKVSATAIVGDTSMIGLMSTASWYSLHLSLEVNVAAKYSDHVMLSAGEHSLGTFIVFDILVIFSETAFL